MKINTIPGVLEAAWCEDVRAVVDTWLKYYLKLEEFKEAKIEIEIPYAKKHGATSWISNLSKAKGALSQEIQECLANEVMPYWRKIGIKYFLIVTPEDSSVTRMSISRFSSKLSQHEIKFIEVSDFEDAINWLKKNA